MSTSKPPTAETRREKRLQKLQDTWVRLRANDPTLESLRFVALPLDDRLVTSIF